MTEAATMHLQRPHSADGEPSANGEPSAPRLRARNPVSLLFSSAPWYAVGYLFTSVICTTAWFAISLVLLLVGVVLSLTWIGLPLLLGALIAVHGLAVLERRRAAGVLGYRVGARTAMHEGHRRRGVRGRLKRRLRSGRTWREIALLVAAYPALFVIDLVALVVWLIPITLISLPFWYRYPPQTFDNGTTGHGVQLGYYPDGPTGTRRYGWFIDDMHSALIAAGVGALLLVLVGSYVAVLAARTHALVVLATASPD